MMNRYSFQVDWSEADTAYVAVCPEFPGLSAFGESPAEAISEMLVALELAIETYRDEGWDLPQPREKQQHSGQIRVRLPKNLHARLARRAADEGVSLNTLIVSYLAEGAGEDAVRSKIGRTLESAIDEWRALLVKAQQQADHLRTTRLSGHPLSASTAAANVGALTRKLDQMFKHAASTLEPAGRAGSRQARLHHVTPGREAPSGAKNRIDRYVSDEWLDTVDKVSTRSENPA